MRKLYSYLEESVGIKLTDKQLEQFEKYYEMLIEKNKVMNLTAITERDEVELKHFIDSVALGEYHKLDDQALKVIDVGTGAGFPGIPLKIAFPQLDVTLFDSLNKKLTRQVAEQLLKKGKAKLKGCKSAKTGKTYDCIVTMSVTDEKKPQFSLEFEKRRGQER